MTIVIGGLFKAIKFVVFKTCNLPIGGDDGFNVTAYFWIGIVVDVFSSTAKLTGHPF
jgi:hypothetical protein